MKFKIKPALIPICILFLVSNMGFNFSHPYLVLQMLGLGLTMQDVTLVIGFAPLLGFFGSPLLGYIGDKFGYKIVLIFVIAMNIILQTSFNYLPVYRKYHHKIALNASFVNINPSINQSDVVWLAKYVEDETQCGHEYLSNMTIRNIVCDEISYDANFQFDKVDMFNATNQWCDDLGIDICKFVLTEDVATDLVYCNVEFNDQEEYETPQEGAHELTFWLYFCLRVLNNIMINTLFNIEDASASILARRERSSYSIILLFAHIGGLLPQFIVGPIVDNIHLGASYTDCLTGVKTTPNDYILPFFISDGCQLISIVFIFFFLEITVEKKVKKKISLKQEFKWLANPAALAFYMVTIITGLVFGGFDTFLFIYCQEELGVTITFLGYISAVSIVSSILVLPFAQIFLSKVGVANTICLGLFMTAARVLAYAFPFTSPPYIFLAYATAEAFFSLYYVAIVNYIGRIAPPELTATGISLQSVLTFIVGKGVGALIAGQIVNAFSIKVMFISCGMFGISISLLYWVIYHMVLKKFELDHTKDLEEKHSEPIKSKLEENSYRSTGVFHSTHF